MTPKHTILFSLLQEIVRVAQSINELATLFRELNVLVIEQGSIIDRIDYNIEQTLGKVDYHCVCVCV